MTIHLLFYIFYQYKLKDIDFSKCKSTPLNYQSNVYITLWVSYINEDWAKYNNSQNIQMKKSYPTIEIPLNLMFHDNLNTYTHPSYSLSSLISRNCEITQKRDHLKTTMFSIWLTHHLTFIQISDLFFQKMYYANGIFSLEEASTTYFKKKVNQLNIYEIIMLQAITRAPSSLNPKKYPKKLLSQMNKLIFKMRKTFPLQYKNLEQQQKLPFIYN